MNGVSEGNAKRRRENEGAGSLVSCLDHGRKYALFGGEWFVSSTKSVTMGYLGAAEGSGWEK